MLEVRVEMLDFLVFLGVLIWMAGIGAYWW